MKLRRIASLPLLFCVQAAFSPSLQAADPPPPTITDFSIVGTQVNLRFPQYPAASNYTLLSTEDLTLPTSPNTNFFLAPYIVSIVTNGTTYTTNYAYEWRLYVTNSTPPPGVDAYGNYFKVRVTPMSSNALLSATVLNRLTYGPTPDDLTNIAAIGPQAFIDQQLAPWSLAENAESADSGIATIAAKFAAFDEPITNTTSKATLTDFRAWHVLRAVNANRQLLEILLQFLENHFVTEYGKSYSWLNNNYSGNTRRRLAAQMEYAENQRWRTALLNPQCTFHDLLKISAESPAMIIYLDTVSSRGDGTRVANENYARELLELFCWGVDNGYEQNDITVMSRAWTGWRVEIVHPTNASNPFALQSTTYMDTNEPLNTIITNRYGVYAFNYRTNYHNTSVKTVFPSKTVPARFGPPWAGQGYQLVLNNGGSASTNTIQDGYQVISHMANQPFTAEYISIKLCRLLVHDGFPNPTTNPNLTNDYRFYDYTRPDLSPEARLVLACMKTWETNSPKGQIWKVLKTITDSELFRSHAASMQKVKTPLEFTVSAIRALRSSTNGSNLDGTFTADTDGFAISGTDQSNVGSQSPLNRMGTMMLFDREAPDGYPEDGPGWISAGTLAERIRWVQSLCITNTGYGHSGNQDYTTNDAQNSISHPVKLIKAKLPPSSWTNAPHVADYFTSILYPGEGAGNLMLYRQAAVDFLNANDSGGSSPFTNLTDTAGATYDTRVRGMVGMLMTLQRFHEQ